MASEGLAVCFGHVPKSMPCRGYHSCPCRVPYSVRGHTARFEARLVLRGLDVANGRILTARQVSPDCLPPSPPSPYLGLLLSLCGLDNRIYAVSPPSGDARSGMRNGPTRDWPTPTGRNISVTFRHRLLRLMSVISPVEACLCCDKPITTRYFCTSPDDRMCLTTSRNARNRRVIGTFRTFEVCN